MTSALLALYDLLWRAALPLLRRRPRQARGWRQRLLADTAEGPFDIWLQAASGGEAQLTNMVVARLAEMLAEQPRHRWRLLLTAGTDEGVDTLYRGLAALPADAPLEPTVAYFPFDAPHLMRRAFRRFAPRLVVTLETELWPGLLATARAEGVPLYLVNGRMSAKSCRAYRRLAGFFRACGPERVWAVSAEDQQRFAELFGAERVERMDNLKFDRLFTTHQPPPADLIDPIAPKAVNPPADPAAALLAGLFPAGAPLVIFGSVHREEEEKILACIGRLLAARPELVIALFPKHLARAEPWLELLARQGITAGRRSQTTAGCPPGRVLVWDLYGELAGAYALADAAFVGGSLVAGGGQNFLEPLAVGLRPVIGRHWPSFAWVGREIVDSGLVEEVADEEELAEALLRRLAGERPRAEICRQVRDFLAPRRGGTDQLCRLLVKALRDGTQPPYKGVQ